MTLIRSLAFNFAFYAWTAVCTLLTLLTPFLSKARIFFPAVLWARGVTGLLRIVGIRVEVRGRHHILPAPCIYASKHQSAWETTAFFGLLGPLSAVVKRELLAIPVFGWYVRQCGQIPVDRAGGDKALRTMLRPARKAVAEKRPILIFPEGTRVAVGAKRAFLPGVFALYNLLRVKVVPVALNSGVFWPRRTFLKRSGTIVVEFLPAIPAGLSRAEFMGRLEQAIEGATRRLVEEAKGTPE